MRSYFIQHPPYTAAADTHVCCCTRDATYHHKQNRSSSLPYFPQNSCKVNENQVEGCVHWSSMLSVFLEIRFSSPSPSVVLPTSITRVWVKALWFRQNVGRRKWRRVSHVTLDGHMCSHRRWLFPLQPFSLRCSLIWPTDCSLPKSDARILSHCHPTEPRCTLVNMSKVGRAPWTHMSHFLDMSHCALNSLPL